MGASSQTVAVSTTTAAVMKKNEDAQRLQLRSGGKKGLAAAAGATAGYLSMEVRHCLLLLPLLLLIFFRPACIPAALSMSLLWKPLNP